MRDRTLLAQPVHKEWPETIPQENTRRGNFDLAVLTPWQLANCNVNDFRQGNLPAPIVIEMGLDYSASHLAQDRDKLIHSQVPHGYLVHLLRAPRPDMIAESIVCDRAGNGGLRTAYACVWDALRRYRFLNDDNVHSD
jgi:hypothetical protein